MNRFDSCLGSADRSGGRFVSCSGLPLARVFRRCGGKAVDSSPSPTRAGPFSDSRMFSRFEPNTVITSTVLAANLALFADAEN
jgi:hypothetical protein